jgi:all-trans-retinol dehydrogenase (NAD+)
MLRHNKGHVVTVASTASFVGVAGLADYCATKAAILSFHEGTMFAFTL